MKRAEDLFLGDTRFLEVDNRLVLPVNTLIQVNIASSDVIHSFALPALGVKGDATAGILNVINFERFKRGVVWGQCSEICGINHRYMPVSLEIVPFTSFFYNVAASL
jgi:cytochrome c oxidase subunit 2